MPYLNLDVPKKRRINPYKYVMFFFNNNLTSATNFNSDLAFPTTENGKTTFLLIIIITCKTLVVAYGTSTCYWHRTGPMKYYYCHCCSKLRTFPPYYCTVNCAAVTDHFSGVFAAIVPDGQAADSDENPTCRWWTFHIA